MAITITDPKLIEQIRAAGEFLEFRDAEGRLISVCTTRLPGTPPPEVLANVKLLTKEDVERIRKQPGQPLEEILAEFRADGVCT